MNSSLVTRHSPLARQREADLSAGLSRHSNAAAEASREADLSAVASREADVSAVASREGGFTLLELMIVLTIIVIMSIVAVPAITSRKSADEVTKAADTIKGVLDRARSYAQANNTYTWVGFYEEDGGNDSANPAPDPCTGCAGRLVIATVASTNGTYFVVPSGGGTYLAADVSNTTSTGTENYIDGTKVKLVGTLVRVQNAHLPLFDIPSGINCNTTPCDTFDTRPAIQNDPIVGFNASRFGELNGAAPVTAPYETTYNGLTKFPFYYPIDQSLNNAQYKFRRTVRFSPTGENRINSTYDVRPVVEFGLVQTRGAQVPTPTSGGGTSTAVYPGNVAAIQIGGFNGDVKIYKR